MTLEELVDKEITVELNSLGIIKIGILDSFSDNGILLKKGDEKYFIPWRSIDELRLKKEGDEEFNPKLEIDDAEKESFLGSVFFLISLTIMSALVTFIIYASFVNSSNLGIPKTIASAIGGPFIIVGFFGTFVSFLIGKTKVALLMVIIIFIGALLFIVYFGIL